MRTMRTLRSRPTMNEKLNWQGTLVAIQPRIRMTRSFDERSRSYLGCVLRILGIIGEEEREFVAGIGESAQAKFRFRAGDVLAGRAADPLARLVQSGIRGRATFQWDKRGRVR